MTAPPLVAAALVLVALTAAAAAPQQPTFRSVSDLVPVQVSVHTARSVVTNLSAADFELTDNGVRQDISAVSADKVSADVTMVVDTSGSVIRSLDRFKSDVRRMADQLRPDEQIRLITFDTDVREAVAMQPANRRVPVDSIRLGNMTSLLDAMLAALARAPRPDRRHLVFVFTDGYDNASVLGYGAIPAIASRSDAVLHIVLVKVPGVPVPSPNPAFDALAAAAARTGGALYPPDQAPADVVSAFKLAVEAFRHGYVLYYTPRGVAREGWHDIKVRISRPGAYEVAARQGYFGG
ncbi:MAG TPA: VWA domain-containing protein [Vicinamibacterales bacterium]|nr:VWA domain-containing protein [Vicinamibacterales bacterium]